MARACFCGVQKIPLDDQLYLSSFQLTIWEVPPSILPAWATASKTVLWLSGAKWLYLCVITKILCPGAFPTTYFKLTSFSFWLANRLAPS